MTDLVQNGQSLLRSLVQFWHWWMGELIAMIPVRLREATRSRQRLDFLPGKDALVVEAVTSGLGQRLETDTSLETLDAESWGQIREICAGQHPRLFLDASDFLRIDLRLPRKANSDLRESVRLQLHLHSPLNPEAIEWNVHPQGIIGEHVEAALIIARRERLEAIELHFAEQGLMPPVIAARVDDIPIILRQPLELGGGRFGSVARRVYLTSALLLLSIPLITILVTDIVTSSNRHEISAREDAIAPKLSIYREAQQAEALRRRAAPITGYPSAISALEELAAQIPEKAWLVSATNSGSKNIALIVDAPVSSQIDDEIRASDNFYDVALVDDIPGEDGRSRQTIELVVK